MELVEARADLLLSLLGHEEQASLELDRGEASLAGHGENEEQPASTRVLAHRWPGSPSCSNQPIFMAMAKGEPTPMETVRAQIPTRSFVCA